MVQRKAYKNKNHPGMYKKDMREREGATEGKGEENGEEEGEVENNIFI